MLLQLTKYKIGKDHETQEKTISGECPVWINPSMIVAVFTHSEGASVALRGFTSNIITKETPDEIAQKIADLGMVLESSDFDDRLPL